MTDPLKIGVVGLGYFSQFHLAAWKAIDCAEIIAATDPKPERRQWAKETHTDRVVEDLAAVLRTAPDVIDLIVPPQVQAKLIRACLAEGRVLVCQKPFCTSPQEAQEVTQQAQAAGTTLVIHENFRFQPWHRAIKSVLDAGDMGQIFSARFSLRPGDGRGAEAYLTRQPAFQSMPRLLIQETGVHFIDLFCWLFGPVDHVYADLRRLNPVLVGEDAGLVILEHAGGIRTTFDGNRLADHETDAPRRTMGEMVIEGEGGTLTLDGYGHVDFRPFGATVKHRVALPFEPDDSFGGGCVQALNQHIVDALTKGGDVENEAHSYLPVIDIVELVYESDKCGRKLAHYR